MQIIRFMDSNGTLYTGCDYNGKTAAVLKGDLFGQHEVTQQRAIVDTLLAPIDPTAILCIGLNYRLHAKETGLEIPKYPVLFMKNPAAVTGPYSPIQIPGSCLDPLQVDYEAELAVVLGKKIKNIKKEDALEAVLGYSCSNDISARQWQIKGGGHQWIRGKSFDTFCPLGPALVTTDEIPDPQDLELECRLNKTTVQNGSTSDMIFSVAEIIAFLSESTTLLPGTIILTGTPSGVGFTRKPPIFLKPNDLLETRIKGIGQMKNPVVAE